MIKLYLDIDGVLLTAKHTQAAPGVEDFINFVTTHFECYWLTTHCKGDNKPALKYLSQFLSPAIISKLQNTVQPTNWDTLKTEAITVTTDFYWLDDQPMQAEIAYLQANGVEHRLLVVNLIYPGELFAVQADLQHLLDDENQPTNRLASFADHLTEQYGEHGTPAREKFEEDFEAFKINVLLEDLRRTSGELCKKKPNPMI